MPSPTTQFKKGEHPSPSTEFKRGFTPWNKGKKGVQQSSRKGLRFPPNSAETRAKISRALTGHTTSEETKRKIRESQIGRRFSMQTRMKMSAAKLGTISPMRGRHHTQETRDKISRILIGKFAGSKNPNWIADRSTLAKKQERNDSAYREWRKSVRDRDGWRCKIADDNCLGKVIAHHILPWARFPDLRYEIKNGLTLCRFHHPRKRDDEMKLAPSFFDLLGVTDML